MGIGKLCAAGVVAACEQSKRSRAEQRVRAKEAIRASGRERIEPSMPSPEPKEEKTKPEFIAPDLNRFLF